AGRRSARTSSRASLSPAARRPRPIAECPLTTGTLTWGTPARLATEPRVRSFTRLVASSSADAVLSAAIVQALGKHRMASGGSSPWSMASRRARSSRAGGPFGVGGGGLKPRLHVGSEGWLQSGDPVAVRLPLLPLLQGAEGLKPALEVPQFHLAGGGESALDRVDLRPQQGDAVLVDHVEGVAEDREGAEVGRRLGALK